MFNKIEHIGIAVKNIEEANIKFEKLMGTAPYKTEEVESEGVITSFFMVGETKIELLQATKPESAIAKFIEKKGEGIHHIAFAVNNTKDELLRLSAESFELIHQNPKDGADNKLIDFPHTKSTNGVLTEICQEKE